jgi:hypothetical protein
MRPEITRTAAPPLAPHRRYFPVPREPSRGLYPGEPEACRRSLRDFLPVVAHLGLLLAIFKVYHVEGPGFRLLIGLALAALPIHYLLPYRLKKAFFLAASLVGLAWVFGLVAAAWVVALAAPPIAACYLPIRWSARAALVGLVALAYGLARAGAPYAMPDSVWPLLGSMMMFRMILYLYEIKHAERPEPLLDTLGYFVLLPNFAFRHFPVIDYRAYRRGYFAADVHAIQRTGLRMMVRGTSHLLLYRLVDRWLISADDVHNALSLAGYLVGNYLLYLRVSGQFHMACGLLHLFGYQLPETHHNYLLATSFTDYWRRINIYWKDFMVRLVFNPVALRLRRRPQPVALAAATVAVFATTWALHAYQAFWLRGTWALSVPDALFWGILGVLVLINVQFDARRPARRPPKGAEWTVTYLAVRAAKTAATFATIALLWSLWYSPSVGAWLAMLRRGLS